MEKLKYLVLFLFLFSLTLFANDEILIRYRFQQGQRYTMNSHTVWNFYESGSSRVINKMILSLSAEVIYREILQQGKEALVEFRITKNLLNGKKNPVVMPNENITFRLRDNGTNDLSRYSGSPARAYFFYSFPKNAVAPGRDTWKNHYYFYTRETNVSIDMDVQFEKITTLKNRKVVLLKMSGKGSIGGNMTGGQAGILQVTSEVHFDHIRGVMLRNVTRGIMLIKKGNALENRADFTATTDVE